MQKLARDVRFSINPFLDDDVVGFNSFASMPAGEGLALFFEITVAIVGDVDEQTGFVVNVVEIDKQVREHVVGIFSQAIRQGYRAGKHIDYAQINRLLVKSRDVLTGKFGRAILSDLTLKLNPFRKIAIDCEDIKMSYFSEKFEFAAMHKLWNDEFSDKKNFEVFGKCANRTGHGHNYVLEVTVKTPSDGSDFCVGGFEKVIDENIIELIDHKNLNADVEEFKKKNPTIENIACFAWSRIVGKFAGAKLHSVTVWETDRTCCTYYG